jgi:opacity protein-like surface antigen
MKHRLPFALALAAALGLSVTGTAVAAGPFGLYEIGGHLSFVSPEDIDGTFGFGAQAYIGEIQPGWTLHPSLWYWGSSIGAGTLDLDVSEIGINCDVHYPLEVEAPVDLYVGGGLGFFRSSVEFATVNPVNFNVTKDSKSETDLGLSLLGGAEYELGPDLTGFGELRYKMGGIDSFRLTIGVTKRLK